MELGNLVFGNSRGEHLVPRRCGWEEVLYELCSEIESDSSSFDLGYGVNFENKVFMINRYYWGDCTCGFENKEFKEKHHKDCYQSLVKSEIIKKLNGFRTSELSYNTTSKIEDSVRKKICKQMKLSYPGGCAVHCTCDYHERYKSWLKDIGYPNGCLDTCLLRKPNFLHKPSGFRIEWYKYPFRDSYMNQKIKLKDFKKIINLCIESLKQ